MGWGKVVGSVVGQGRHGQSKDQPNPHEGTNSIPKNKKVMVGRQKE